MIYATTEAKPNINGIIAQHQPTMGCGHYVRRRRVSLRYADILYRLSWKKNSFRYTTKRYR